MELTTARVHAVIKSFFENMTAERWRSIKSGNPDIATKTLLAEAIIEIIEIASKHFQIISQNANIEVSEEAVLDSMGNILPKPLAEALKTYNRGHEDSTENLEELFAKEVVLSVQSAQSADSKTSLTLEDQHIIPPNQLNKIINFGGRMIKAFISVMKSVGMSSDTVSLTDSEVDTEILDSQLDRQHEILMIGSQGSLNTATLKTTEFVIQKAVAELLPVQDQTEDPEFNKLKSATIEESKQFAKELTRSAEAEIQNSPESDEVITPASFKDKLEQPQKNTLAKIKAFFAKQFAKATILRAVKNIRATFQNTGKDESSESLEQVVHDFLLQTVKDVSENETCQLELFKNISMGKSLEFTNQLTEMLDHHASPGMAPETLPDRFRRAYINRKVRVFLGLMRWWFFTQAESQSQSVMLALRGTQSVTEPQTSVPTSHPKPDHTVPDASVRKAYIKVILCKLFSRIAKKLNIMCTCGCSENIHSWVLEEVWDQLQDKELIITPQTLKNLEKHILKDLRDVFGSVESVQVALELQKSTAVKLIATSLTEHLSKPKKTPSAIVRFFTALAKAITKPFKRTT
ncbi:unnamed protein product [Oreochromis niloticus]|nr:unnamed protein product [Mustela putorius furo]